MVIKGGFFRFSKTKSMKKTQKINIQTQKINIQTQYINCRDGNAEIKLRRIYIAKNRLEANLQKSKVLIGRFVFL